MRQVYEPLGSSTKRVESPRNLPSERGERTLWVVDEEKVGARVEEKAAGIGPEAGEMAVDAESAWVATVQAMKAKTTTSRST